MTPRLVISDVDGTLVNHAKELAPATIAAVKRLREAGVGFTLISARPPSGLVPLATALGLDEPLGAYNGGVIATVGGDVLERHTVPEEVVRGLFAMPETGAADPWIFADGIWHAKTLKGKHLDHERKASLQEPVQTDDMAALYAKVEKLTWVSDDAETLRDLTEQAQARFGTQATIGQSQPYYLDVTATVANKGDGIGTLARARGVELGEVVVLGDMYNDLAMFTRAGLAVAMGQAPEEVRNAAAHVSTSNDEDGVAHAIDSYILPLIEGHP